MNKDSKKVRTNCSIMRQRVLSLLCLLFMCVGYIIGANEITHFSYEDVGRRVDVTYSASGKAYLNIYDKSNNTLKQQVELTKGQKQTKYYYLPALAAGDYYVYLNVNGKNVGKKIPFSAPSMLYTVYTCDNTGLSACAVKTEFLPNNRVRIYYKLSSSNLYSAQFGIFDTNKLSGGVYFANALQKVSVYPQNQPEGYIEFNIDSSWEKKNLIVFLYENGTDWSNMKAYSASFCPYRKSQFYGFSYNESDGLNLKHYTLPGETSSYTISTLDKTAFTSSTYSENVYDYVNTDVLAPGEYTLKFKTVTNDSKKEVKINTSRNFVIDPRLRINSYDNFMNNAELYYELSNNISSAKIEVSTPSSVYPISSKTLSVSGSRKGYTLFNTAYWQSGNYTFSLYEDGKFKKSVKKYLSPIGPGAAIIVERVSNGSVEGRFKFPNSDYYATIRAFRPSLGNFTIGNEVATIDGAYNRFNVNTKNWLSDDYILALYDSNNHVVATTSFKCQNNYTEKAKIWGGVHDYSYAELNYELTNNYGKSPKTANIIIFKKVYDSNDKTTLIFTKKIPLDIHKATGTGIKVTLKELDYVNNGLWYYARIEEDGELRGEPCELCFERPVSITPVYANKITNISQSSGTVDVECSLKSDNTTGEIQLVDTKTKTVVDSKPVSSDAVKVSLEKPVSNSSSDLYAVRLVTNEGVSDTKKITEK